MQTMGPFPKNSGDPSEKLELQVGGFLLTMDNSVCNRKGAHRFRGVREDASFFATEWDAQINVQSNVQSSTRRVRCSCPAVCGNM